MPNKRVYFAIEQVGFAPDGSNTYVAAHGVQSCGITTTFNLEQVFALGQLAIYDNIESIPNIEVTLEKVLDGYCPLYLLGTKGSTSASLSGRQNAKTAIAMSIFPDTLDSSTGTPVTQVSMSGMVVSSVQYQFPIDGNFSESTTWVGNNKVWRNAIPFTFSGQFLDNADFPIASAGSGGVNRRQHIQFRPTVATLDANSQVADSNCTILPRNIPGISSSGTNNLGGDGFYECKVQSISVSTDLGREQILQLGHKTPYHRFVTFPVEVTTEIEVISVSGDGIGATEDGIYGNGNNLRNESIRVSIQEGLRLNMGTKNKLASVGMSAGDAGGGNQTLTYSYTTFNDMDVSHWNDATTAIAPAQGGFTSIS
jgi:hypothetical protein